MLFICGLDDSLFKPREIRNRSEDDMCYSKRSNAAKLHRLRTTPSLPCLRVYVSGKYSASFSQILWFNCVGKPGMLSCSSREGGWLSSPGWGSRGWGGQPSPAGRAGSTPGSWTCCLPCTSSWMYSLYFPSQVSCLLASAFAYVKFKVSFSYNWYFQHHYHDNGIYNTQNLAS